MWCSCTVSARFGTEKSVHGAHSARAPIAHITCDSYLSPLQPPLLLPPPPPPEQKNSQAEGAPALEQQRSRQPALPRGPRVASFAPTLCVEYVRWGEPVKL